MSFKHDLKTDMLFALDALRCRTPAMLYTAGWLGYGNLGDETLLAAARRLFPDYDFACLRSRVHGPLIRLVRGRRVALLAGGTLINGAPAWLEAFRLSRRHCAEGLVFGSGVQDPAFWTGRAGWVDRRAEWVAALADCRFVGVRGPRSVELLREAGLDRVEMIGDPVLVFADMAGGDPQRAETGVLGLNIGQSGGHLWGDEARVREEAAKLAAGARARGWKVEWFVIWPRDRGITEAAAAARGTGETVHHVYTDHHTYLARVGRCDLFVGLKLHAVVLAVCAGVPSLMLEYRPKCRDFMLSIGQESAVVRTDALRADALLETLDDWRGERPALAARLREGIRPLVERQRARAAELAAVLAG